MKKTIIRIWSAVLFMMITGASLAGNELEADDLLQSENKKYRHLEIESLVPVFFMGGYHAATGLRWKDFRFRASVIYGGDFDAEPSGIGNSKDKFERFYDHGSFGVFADYFAWRGLHVYMFVENHRWIIKNKSNNESVNMRTIDIGPGIAYQFLIFDRFYIQPGYHLYFRNAKETDVGGARYSIPRMDHTIVLRLGCRLFSW